MSHAQLAATDCERAPTAARLLNGIRTYLASFSPHGRPGFIALSTDGAERAKWADSNRSRTDPRTTGSRGAQGMQDLPAMMKAAGRGDAMAQVMVGMAYSNGKGVPQDRAKGVKWL